MFFLCSLGVSPTSDKEDGGDTRFDAIHIIGVDDMSTSRVFDYFGEFAPAAIEWIDDTSCELRCLHTRFLDIRYLDTRYLAIRYLDIRYLDIRYLDIVYLDIRYLDIRYLDIRFLDT